MQAALEFDSRGAPNMTSEHNTCLARAALGQHSLQQIQTELEIGVVIASLGFEEFARAFTLAFAPTAPPDNVPMASTQPAEQPMSP